MGTNHPKRKFDGSAQYFDPVQAALFCKAHTLKLTQLTMRLDEIEEYAHASQIAYEENQSHLWHMDRLFKVFSIRLRDITLTLQSWQSTIVLMTPPDWENSRQTLSELASKIELTQRRAAILTNQYEVFAVSEDFAR